MTAAAPSTSVPARGGPGARRTPRRPRPVAVAAAAAVTLDGARGEFTSYYGRPVVKPSPWEDDIPAYLFLGGLAGRLLAARRRRRPHRPAGAAPHRRGSARSAAISLQLRRAGARPRQAGAVRQHAARRQADLADVGRHLDPDRLRAVAGLAAAAESSAALLPGPLPSRRRPAAGGLRPSRPASAPRWSPRRSRPTPRCSSPTPPRPPGTRPTASCRSSSSAPRPPPSGGLGMVAAPSHEAGPARRLAVGGAAARAGRRAPDGARRWASPPSRCTRARPAR